MKRLIEVKSFRDAGYPGNVYQVDCIIEEEATFCDHCEDQIADKDVVPTEDGEELCPFCHKKEMVKSYYDVIPEGSDFALVEQYLFRLYGI